MVSEILSITCLLHSHPQVSLFWKHYLNVFKIKLLVCIVSSMYSTNCITIVFCYSTTNISKEGLYVSEALDNSGFIEKERQARLHKHFYHCSGIWPQLFYIILYNQKWSQRSLNTDLRIYKTKFKILNKW